MERVSRYKNKILFLLGIFVAAVALSAALPTAEAGVTMSQPEPQQKLQPGEFYPESRFGQPPMRVDTGVGSRFAAREAEEMETTDEGEFRPSRSPAGLEFASGNTGRMNMGPAVIHGGAPIDGTAMGGPGVQRTHTQTSQMSARSARDGESLRDNTRPVQADEGSATPNSVVARKGVQEVALIASDLGYFPKTVFVSRDVPVRMFVTGSSKNTLCIMMDSFQVRRQVRSQKIEEVTFTPNVPGKYRFYCPVNGMEGTMVVKELANQTQEDQRMPASDTRAPASTQASYRGE